MSKSNSFFGLRSGSTKSHTYSVLKGQQITKDRVTDVANPKTTAQMTQRATFANCVKFYKHATQGLFKFAFEDKKPTESDYNAFVRMNVGKSVLVSKDQQDNQNFPAIGAGWLLSNGSLSMPDVLFDDTATNSHYLSVPNLAADITTVGQLCTAIKNAYQLQDGDIVTLVAVNSSIANINETATKPVRWSLGQFVIDSASTVLLSDFEFNVNVAAGKWYFQPLNDYTKIGAAAVIFSRNIKGQPLKVSPSILVNNNLALQALAGVSADSYRETALATWGATGEAILQGGLLVQQ